MIGTNRDLTAMREAARIRAFPASGVKSLPSGAADAAFIDQQIASLSRERVAYALPLSIAGSRQLETS